MNELKGWPFEPLDGGGSGAEGRGPGPGPGVPG